MERNQMRAEGVYPLVIRALGGPGDHAHGDDCLTNGQYRCHGLQLMSHDRSRELFPRGL